MSLLVAVFYWVVIPALAFLIARWLLRRATTALQKRVIVIASVAVFLGLLWIAAGEKWWLDYQVRELCAKDGGIKVYETVKLPPEKFNQWGQPNFYRPDQGENALGAEYKLKTEIRDIKTGNPSLRRYHVQVFKRDGFLLAESIGYDRGGGDLSGPWQPSGYSCPPQHGEVVIDKLFIQDRGEPTTTGDGAQLKSPILRTGDEPCRVVHG